MSESKARLMSEPPRRWELVSLCGLWMQATTVQDTRASDPEYQDGRGPIITRDTQPIATGVKWRCLEAACRQMPEEPEADAQIC